MTNDHLSKLDDEELSDSELAVLLMEDIEYIHQLMGVHPTDAREPGCIDAYKR